MKKNSITLLLFLYSCLAFSQNISYIESTLFAESAFPTTLRDTKVDGYAPLKTAFFIEEKGAKVGFAPFLAFGKEYHDSYSESRIQLAYKDNITNFGIGWKLNPTHPLSKNGNSKYLEFRNLIPRSDRGQIDYHLGIMNSLERKIKAINKTIDSLNQLERSNIFDAKITTAIQQCRKQKSFWADSLDRHERQKTNLENAADKAFSDSLLTYYEQLNFSQKPVFGLSATTSLFPVVGGTVVDKDNNGYNDNQHVTKAWNISLTVDWRLNRRNQLSFLIGPQWNRKTADGSLKFSNYYNVGVTYGLVLVTLNKKGDAYKKTDAYKENFFIPSIVVGISWEHTKSYRGKVIDNILASNTVTLFFDFKITDKAMFRIGLPYKFQKFEGSTKTNELTFTTQLSLQIAGLN